MLRRIMLLLALAILAATGWQLMSKSSSRANPVEAEERNQPVEVLQPEGRQTQASQQIADKVEYPTISSRQVSTSENQADFPALTSTSSGEFWAAWIEWDGKEADQIVVRNLGWDSQRASVVLKNGSSSHRQGGEESFAEVTAIHRCPQGSITTTYGSSRRT